MLYGKLIVIIPLQIEAHHYQGRLCHHAGFLPRLLRDGLPCPSGKYPLKTLKPEPH